MDLSLTELEAAINWWREQRPARSNESALSAEVSALAKVYALMIFHRRASLDLAAESAAVQQLIAAYQSPSSSPHGGGDP
jgi:hypothetical protein